MNRIYLLTGAAGLLGSNISRQLVDAGKTVRALVLKGDPAARYIPDAVTCWTAAPWKICLRCRRTARLW